MAPRVTGSISPTHCETPNQTTITHSHLRKKTGDLHEKIKFFDIEYTERDSKIGVWDDVKTPAVSRQPKHRFLNHVRYKRFYPYTAEFVYSGLKKKASFSML